MHVVAFNLASSQVDFSQDFNVHSHQSWFALQDLQSIAATRCLVVCNQIICLTHHNSATPNTSLNLPIFSFSASRHEYSLFIVPMLYQFITPLTSRSFSHFAINNYQPPRFFFLFPAPGSLPSQATINNLSTLMTSGPLPSSSSLPPSIPLPPSPLLLFSALSSLSPSS